MSFIDVKGLRAGYGNSVVLRDIDLEVDEGEAVAVVGKNGAGKSTLLMSFFGGTNVSGGSMQVGGVELRGLPAYRAAKQGVALSPQGRMILPHLTVNENLLLGAACRRKGPWTVEKVFALFPDSARAAACLGNGIERRPTADARGRPRIDGQSARAAARRAVGRAVAGAGRRTGRHFQSDSRGGRRRADRRTAFESGAPGKSRDSW